ncbi:hypothetical protein FJR11_22500 [Anabaena sp. UHCC 0187]|uniref:hypothetical protein n=1 Tax=Anabaena sp. UHCC 0187 TaxID=2590018 RepID=UPI0014482A7C|nr:hypothetical protein [Anabaena sp. UHCC 0187]MTJ15282.1 hypothetical protein [Anabaena sp. UHCC 0187]
MNRKILILGSTQHSRLVTAYNWHELPDTLNIADYDILILNVIPLMDKAYLETINLDFLPSSKQFGNLLFGSKSEIIIIGLSGKNIKGVNLINSWIPIIHTLNNEISETVEVVNQVFTYYFEKIDKSFYNLNKIRMLDDNHLEYYFSLINININAKNFNSMRIHKFSIAETKYKKPIGYEINIRVTHEGKTITSGNIIYLPPTTKISNYDAINLILTNRYNLQLEQISPPWLENYKLPNQIFIEDKISNYISDIQYLESQLTMEQEKLKVEKRYHKLLYEQGVDGLEPIVREVLRELGAIVDDPIPRENKEDGLLKDPQNREAILEIKGRTKSLALADVRQLDQWVRDSLFSDNPKERKGIIIANMYCNVPLEQREKPFPDNCIKMAKDYKYCLLTTRQLHHAIFLKQQNQFKETEFWDTVFNTDGVCLLPETEYF